MTSEMNMPSIKAVIFDLGGVLYRFRDYKAFVGLLKRAGTDPVIREKVLAWETGDLSTEAIRDILEEGIGKIPENVPNLEDVPFEAVMGEPFDKIWKSIDKLKENKIKVAMLTNNGWWTDKKEKTTIVSNTEKFDVIVESCRVGLRKPDPKIFDIVLQKLNAKPDECVFIDDLTNNVEGALKLGIHAVQMIDGNEDFVLSKLTQYTGIKF